MKLVVHTLKDGALPDDFKSIIKLLEPHNIRIQFVSLEPMQYEMHISYPDDTSHDVIFQIGILIGVRELSAKLGINVDGKVFT